VEKNRIKEKEVKEKNMVKGKEE
jgi:hypothetical protein